jgi:hypothetical protein
MVCSSGGAAGNKIEGHKKPPQVEPAGVVERKPVYLAAFLSLASSITCSETFFGQGR